MQLTYPVVVKIIEKWFKILTRAYGVKFEEKPFILRPYQKRVLKEIIENPGKNILIEKSRQMGISWLLAAWFAILFLCGSNEQLLVLGKTEDLIDNAVVDTNTLMGKMKFLILTANEPAIKMLITKRIRIQRRMQNLIELNYFFMKNSLLGNIITGKASSAKGARGGTYTVVMWDEADFTENSHQIFASISINSQRIIMLSTLNLWNRGSMFNDLRRKLKSTADTEEIRNFKSAWHLITIMWSEYFDQEWYEKQKALLNNDPMLIASELDINDSGTISHTCFSTVGDANFNSKAVYNLELENQSVLAFDFGISDYTTGVALQYNKTTGEILVIDAFEIDNVPFSLILQSIWAPSPLILNEICRRTKPEFAKNFQRFYLNARTSFYKRFIVSGDPAGSARSISSGSSILDEIGKYTTKMIFYREDTESMLSWIRGKADKIYINPELTNFKEMVKNYRYEINRDGNPVAPRHDEYSHLADAFRYGILSIRRLFIDGPKMGYANQEHNNFDNNKSYRQRYRIN